MKTNIFRTVLGDLPELEELIISRYLMKTYREYQLKKQANRHGTIYIDSLSSMHLQIFFAKDFAPIKNLGKK